MPQVEREIVKARAARLREAAAVRKMAWLDSLVGSTQSVLVENAGKGFAGNLASVHTASIICGDVVQVTIAARTGNHLVGIFQ